MPWQRGEASSRRSAGVSRPRSATRSSRATRPQALIVFVSRLLVAQAGAGAAIGLAYSRRNAPWLLLTIAVAVAVVCLAGIVRSGSHTVWLLAICVESTLVAVGLFRYAYARYMGGTLLAIITLATLLHPAVARAFAATPRWHRPVPDHPGLAEGTADVLPGRAAG